MHWPCRSCVSEAEVHVVAALMDSDRHQIIRELARQTGFAYTTVLNILKERLGIRKIASRRIPHHLTEMQKWLRYDAAQTHWES
ncbi:histone-lysine N-methyltransferase SETMAR [Trichonephila clavipes]|uniref:Histone-lysine N-methyltransferase SETMAR n=1 Tax=Trichonephila clavipes TaxID=2585209 RepID=A0A8X6SXP4_TRICX|nr:histone-lysine N-methyltransferase SETMAR [Trichonephila clavipes]